MLRLQIKRKLQIDEPEILAAAPSERGAEAIERFGRAGLRVVDQQRQFLAAPNLVQFAGDQRMARQRLVEGFENLQRVVLLSLPHEHAGIGLHDAQRAVVELVGAFQPLLRFLAVAGGVVNRARYGDP